MGFIGGFRSVGFTRSRRRFPAFIEGGLGGGVSDHGALTGLSDDDHTQYHNDTRGDARYFQKSEFITSSAGAGDSGKPVALDAAGHIDATMINDADIDHTLIGSIGVNSHAAIDTHIADGTIHFTEGSIDHGSIAGLADDDHTQYHTDARALTWLGTRSTTDLPEGANLYYTDERVDDRVAALIQDGTGIAWTYVDAAGTLTGNVTLAPFDTDDLSEGATNLYFTDERVDDRVNALLVEGTNITLTYNDVANTLTIDAAGGGVTDHGALTGLADDDHTQYVLENATRPMSANWDTGGFNFSNIAKASFGVSAVDANAQVHIQTSAVAGAVASIAGDSLIIDRSGTNYIYMRSTDESGLMFGDAASRTDGFFLYNHSNTDAYIGAAGSIRMRLFGATGNVTVGVNSDGGAKLHVQESAAAGAPALGAADEFVVEKNADVAINIQTSNDDIGSVIFSDNVRRRGAIDYDHSGEHMSLRSEGAEMVRIDSTGVRVHADMSTEVPLNLFEVIANPAATPDDTKSVSLVNEVAATAGNQKYSPMVRWEGKGWKTNATAASQSVEYRAYVIPVQGAANPSSVWALESSINGAAYTQIFRVTSAGNMMMGTTTENAAAILNLVSTTKGFLPPRMTTAQRNAISSPPQGLSIFNTTLVAPNVYDGTSWENQAGGFVHYAQIYLRNGSTSQTITTGGTFEKFTGFATNGSSEGMTADAANDQITVTKAGHYLVMFQCSLSGTNGGFATFRIAWNGVAQDQIYCRRETEDFNDPAPLCMMGIIDATSATTDIEVEFTMDSSGHSITAREAQLTATWLGTT